MLSVMPCGFAPVRRRCTRVMDCRGGAEPSAGMTSYRQDQAQQFYSGQQCAEAGTQCGVKHRRNGVPASAGMTALCT
jgi:hypothetical protein